MSRAGAADTQHRVNLLVLLFSAAIAWAAPLQTFLLAYAVLGPFHYLTEIAWLRRKDFYFQAGIVSPRTFLLAATALCGVACLDLRMHRGWTAYAIAALLALSLGALVRRWAVLAGAVALLIATRFFVHGYGLFLAVFVPTVAHVYFFTALFLLGAVVRGRQGQGADHRLGWLNAALLLGLPILMAFAGSSWPGLEPGRLSMHSELTFAPIHEYLAGLVGLGMHFEEGRRLDAHAIAVFRVLGFMYLHHYLNWFAKTELLAWHRVSRRSWIAIGALYAAALGAYAYSFAAGFFAAYFLSLLHVLLELPLDWHAAHGLWRGLRVSRPIASPRVETVKA